MDWTALVSTFGLLFLAELGDKTQLAVITQTCRYRRPWAVFLGATLALAVVTALGVVAGEVAGRLLPAVWIQRLAAVGFVVMGGLLLWESLRAGRQAQEEACPTDDPPPTSKGPDWRAFGTTFTLLTLAELGDKTQLAVLAQASHTDSPWTIFSGAILALAAVTALGVAFGQGLVRLVPERWLRGIAAVAFIVMGALIGFGVL